MKKSIVIVAILVLTGSITFVQTTSLVVYNGGLPGEMYT
jgi:hypothetical protein